MKARQVVVVAECRVRLAGFPVALGTDTGAQRAVLQHRQIKPAAVPGHQVGGEAFQSVIEAADQLAFRGVRFTETPDLEPFAAAQCARNRHDAVLRMAQKIAALGLAAQREHRLRDLRIGQPFQPMQAAAEVGVGNGLDVEDENVHTRAANINAFMSRTALCSPVKIARAMIAWPIFNSTISRIAATGCTL